MNSHPVFPGPAVLFLPLVSYELRSRRLVKARAEIQQLFQYVWAWQSQHLQPFASWPARHSVLQLSDDALKNYLILQASHNINQ